jgi:hypothetical protein
VQETSKVDEYFMNEFKTLLDKLAAEDKYVKDYPMDVPKNESDKRVTENYHLNVMGDTPVNSSNSETVTEDINDGIPFEAKTLRKIPITRTEDFLW